MTVTDYTSDLATQQRKEAADAARTAAARKFHRDQAAQYRSYLTTQQAAKRYLLAAYANGATSVPTEIYNRATANALPTPPQKEITTMTPQQFEQIMNMLTTIHNYLQLEYHYGNGTPVPDHPKTRAIFNQFKHAHNQQPPMDSQTLSTWHKQPQQGENNGHHLP